VTVLPQPVVGDAFGEMLRTALAVMTGRGPRPVLGSRDPVGVVEIVERDDGFVSAAPADRYLAGPEAWPEGDRAAVNLCRGRVLDVGAGGGRIALALQERGLAVTALDVSPGAIEVCRARGVRETFVGTIDQHRGEYDTFVLWCNNLGLLGSPAAAPAFLDALARLAAPGARILAQGTNPYGGAGDPVHDAYHRRNRERGRLAGHLTVRVRHRELATPWFDYLLCSPDELREVLRGTGWQLADLDDSEPSRYTAVLSRSPRHRSTSATPRSARSSG
jgi:SAM-dependent methyltransferase